MKSKQNGQKLVFEEGDVFTAQKYLRNLASGRSPLDGADLAEDHLLREPAMVNALNLAADLLEAWLDNGGFNRVEPKRTRPFAISDADRAKIVISKEPVGIMTIAKRIAQVLPYDMQTVRYAQISGWLQYIGALEWEGEPGQKRRVSTPTGQQIGIRTVDRRGVDGSSSRKNIYDENAQRLIVDNLEGILTYASQIKVQEAAEKVEKAKAELEAIQREAERVAEAEAQEAAEDTPADTTPAKEV